MTEPISAILIGAGQRGVGVYANYAVLHPRQLKFVGVAEPDAQRRNFFSQKHKIPEQNRFASWEEILSKPQMADTAFICTPDWQHFEPAVQALTKGYHVLLEKPVATSIQKCQTLLQTCLESENQLHICYVLRHTRHFQTMRNIIQSDRLGEIINVDHRENVAWWHMAHSFVRGNWNNDQTSSPMILAKCCHDLDILQWILDRNCTSLSSTGSLIHFKPENAPQGAPLRCLDGCPASKTCIYYAPFLYSTLIPLWRSFLDTSHGISKLVAQLKLKNPGVIAALSFIIPVFRRVHRYNEWPVSVLAIDPTPANIHQALKEGPYGRCVYHCDNNVVDHQVVSMQFEGEISVTLTMHGHSHTEYRTTRIEGTRGRLMAEFGIGGSRITIDEHLNDRREIIDTSAPPGSGHGGGDLEIVHNFVQHIANDNQYSKTAIQHSLDGHILAFAAEEARIQNQLIHIENYKKTSTF